MFVVWYFNFFCLQAGSCFWLVGGPDVRLLFDDEFLFFISVMLTFSHLSPFGGAFASGFSQNKLENGTFLCFFIRKIYFILTLKVKILTIIKKEIQKETTCLRHNIVPISSIHYGSSQNFVLNQFFRKLKPFRSGKSLHADRACGDL